MASHERLIPQLTRAAEVGRYVYCIVEAKEDFELGPIGIGEDGTDVYSIRVGDLAAVVSDTPLRPYDPSDGDLRIHREVNEAVMREHTAIPVSFGTIFRRDEDVVEFLRTTGKAFHDVFGQIRGKVEMGIEVRWDRERLVARIQQESEEVRALKARIAQATNGSTYFARTRLGQLIEDALEERASAYVREIEAALEPLVAACRRNPPVGDRTILNAAFLVDRGRKVEFDQAVACIAQRHAPSLSIESTGPAPPDNFVNIKLKLERAH